MIGRGREAGIDDSVNEQVQDLQYQLQAAHQKLSEQSVMLNQLTSPPFAYATVVAKSEWAPEKALQFLFNDIYGNDVKADEMIKSLGAYRSGDVLAANSTKLPQEVLLAEKRVIVGFQKGTVIVQLDDGPVVLNNLKQMPLFYEVVGTENQAIKTVVIMSEGRFFEVLYPKDRDINAGDTVRIVAQSMQIIDVAGVQIAGNIGYLRRAIDDTFAEIDFENSVKVVFSGKFSDSLEKGDRVVLDSSATVIVRNLGKADERFRFTAVTNVTWDDIGGLAAAKQELIEAVLLPHTNPDIFHFYGKRPVKGILLYGPPGCGKTMLVKALATELAKLYQANGKSSGLISVKGPEILDRYVGVAEATIRQIFVQAQKHREEHGYPAVIFIDEADAILGKRGSGVCSDMERTIVPMFLTEMDGLESSSALVILATNRADMLDPAVVRDGRIDRKVKVARPTPAGVAEILALNLKNIPLYNGFTSSSLAKLGSAELFSPKRVLYEVQTHASGTHNFTLGDIVNGGMVVNVVEQATSFALRRDLAGSAKKAPQGLLSEDLIGAVDEIERQNHDLNHTDELQEFVHDFKEDIVSIVRLRQGTV